MAPAADNALIVQSDCSVLLEVHAPRAEEARAALAPFAELVKSPEHVHTYRLTPLSIWNARAAGLAAEQMVESLREHARYPVPPGVEQEVFELAARYGRVVIARDGDGLRCTCNDTVTAERLAWDKEAGRYLTRRIDAASFRVDPAARGVLKQALVGAGYPAEDLAGYVAGEPFDVALRENAASGTPFRVRDYQRHAAEAFYLAGAERGGSGVIVLPCGAGKTIVGLAAMELVKQTTLVLTTSLTAVKQWRRELLDKTTLRPEDIAEYTGEQKNTGPVTLTTYQILTWRALRPYSRSRVRDLEHGPRSHGPGRGPSRRHRHGRNRGTGQRAPRQGAPRDSRRKVAGVLLRQPGYSQPDARARRRTLGRRGCPRA